MIFTQISDLNQSDEFLTEWTHEQLQNQLQVIVHFSKVHLKN